jgi:DNA-directed RNA polymerase specialized sigma24 family protein
MKDPAHAAGVLVQEAFQPFFDLPPELGRELYLTIRRRLQANRYLGEEHADEVFQQTLCDAFSYLSRHGGAAIRHTRGWLHRISKNATLHYLEARSEVDSPANPPLDALLEGEALLADGPSAGDDLARVLRALEALRPRHQQVIRLELVEGLEDAESQKKMEIESNAYFRKLKCEAYRALKDEISRLDAN